MAPVEDQGAADTTGVECGAVFGTIGSLTAEILLAGVGVTKPEVIRL